jgi:hypothetical protein
MYNISIDTISRYLSLFGRNMPPHEVGVASIAAPDLLGASQYRRNCTRSHSVHPVIQSAGHRFISQYGQHTAWYRHPEYTDLGVYQLD